MSTIRLVVRTATIALLLLLFSLQAAVPAPVDAGSSAASAAPRNIRFFLSAAQSCRGQAQTSFGYAQKVFAPVLMDALPAGTKVEITWSGGAGRRTRTDTEITRSAHPQACLDGFWYDPLAGGGSGSYSATLHVNGAFHGTQHFVVAQPVTLPAPSGTTQGSAPECVQSPDKLLLAFYYLWWSPQEFTTRHMVDLPVAAYSSNDRSALSRHIRQAQAGCLTGFISSWAGVGTETDRNLPLLLDSAKELNFKITIYFETEDVMRRGDLVGQLRHVLAQYAVHPAFLRSGGKPVIFFWHPQDFGDPATWQRVRQQLDPNRSLLWSAELLDERYLLDFDDIHFFSAGQWYADTDVARVNGEWSGRVAAFNHSHGTQGTFTPGIAPGWDESRAPNHSPPHKVFARDDGRFYEKSWRAAMSINPRWITLTSFNEWFEGTQIEPSHAYGERYIELTRQYANLWRSATAGGAAPGGVHNPAPANTPTPAPGWRPQNLRFFTSATPGCESAAQSSFRHPHRVHAQVFMDVAPAGTVVEVTWQGGDAGFARTDQHVVPVERKPGCVTGFWLDSGHRGIGPGTYTVALRIGGIPYGQVPVTIR